MPKLLADATVDFDREHDFIGPSPDEVVMHYAIASGRISGPRIALSSTSHCGWEWDTVRGDGMIAFELRQILHTAVGDPVSVTLSGLYDCGEDAYLEALDNVLDSTVHATFAVRFYAGAKEYRWLNHALYVGRGKRDFGSGAFSFQIFDLDDSACDC